MSGPSAVDTIAARATPPGRGGVGIIRVSGPQAFEIATAVAGPLPAPRHAALRLLREANGAPLDRAIVLVFPGPHSFTGEDVVEFQLHGSPVLAALLLGRLVELGAREALPGEFTQRAFLNDRIDLAQAEAVADLVDAVSAEAARAAMRSLEGEFSSRVNEIAERLTVLRARLEAGLDFPEEGVDDFSDPELAEELAALGEALAWLRASAAHGRALRDGLTLVIAGPPNAGKSSLLNRLAGYEAAIVAEGPGTTRDLVREDILVDGMPLRVIDTAGLREAVDGVEQEGIRRAREALRQADAVLLVDDGRASAGPMATEELPDGVAVLRIRNKIDLDGLPPGEAQDAAGRYVLQLSALTGAGVDRLRERLKALAGHGEGGGTFSARRRHLDALAVTAAHVATAADQFGQGRAVELAAEELRQAQESLGEITGRVSSEDLLGRIFSAFCIGK
jgi:tRNA modification GTPase